MPPNNVAIGVNRLTQVDLSGRGTIEPILRAVTEKYGANTAMQAARRLHATVQPGDTVGILTGFLIPPEYAPETDGPLGAVILARAIRDRLGGVPIIMCEEAAVEACKAAGRAANLEIDHAGNLSADRDGVGIVAFPTEEAEARSFVDTFLAYEPVAVVAVEKPSPNRAGRYHTMTGQDISAATAKIDTLFEASNLDEEVFTVGVGDGGNEIGMGGIEATVREDVPNGDTCQCSCREGIAARIETDLVVPAAVSNWGAYGITTCLSALGEDDGLLHSAETEAAMLEAVSEAGGVDGITGENIPSCDGLASEVHESLVCLLQALENPITDQ